MISCTVALTFHSSLLLILGPVDLKGSIDCLCRKKYVVEKVVYRKELDIQKHKKRKNQEMAVVLETERDLVGSNQDAVSSKNSEHNVQELELIRKR